VGFIVDLHRFIVPIVSTAVSAVILLGIRSVLLRWFRKQHASGPSQLSVFALGAIHLPSLFWCLALSLHFGLRYAKIPPEDTHFAQELIQVLILFSVTMALANYLNRVIQHSLSRIHSPLAQNGLVRGVAQCLVYIVGILTILSKLEVRIEPLLTALGVGGLAVSLALQDTLGNIFAGINLLIDRAIRLGDRIQLDSGQQGVVEDIGWRTTKLRLDSKDLLIIPNVKLAQNVAIRRTPPEGPPSSGQ
jgi:small-conductance mechanosensitive channel